MKNGRIVLMIVIMLSLQIASAQEPEKVHDHESLKGSHRISLGLGHTHLSKGKNIDGEEVWLPVTSWSLAYDYHIAKKWSIGLQSDMVLEEFIVEDHDGQELEREKPIALALVGFFKPGKHFSFIGGAGIEMEKEKNLGFTRLGVEFGAELKNHWEAGIAVLWDDKWGYYNSWVIEFTFSKLFRKKK